VLDPALKRAWLGVLPLMVERHREELQEILWLEDRGPEASAARRGGATDSSSRRA
jgi:hypothetical protein